MKETTLIRIWPFLKSVKVNISLDGMSKFLHQNVHIKQAKTTRNKKRVEKCTCNLNVVGELI